MLSTPWIAALAALFLWWFATGALLWRVHHADRAGQGAHRASVIYGLPLLALGALGTWISLESATIPNVWIAFLSALSLWAWVELAFLSGIITGPNTAPSKPALNPLFRFLSAFGTVAWHELLLLAMLAVLWTSTQEAGNAFAFWTFAVLFAARISAKLNLFFGVPHINLGFLPKPLTHLAGHFRQGPVTAFFPLSATALAFATACFLERAYTATEDGAVLGFTLLTVLTSLALLEHWFMVWRIRDDKLWAWLLPAKPHLKTTTVETSHGL